MEPGTCFGHGADFLHEVADDPPPPGERQAGARIRARLHAMTTEAHGQQRPSVHVASVVLSALRCCQRANSGGRRRAGRGCCLQGEGIHSVVLAAVPAGVLELTCGSQKGWRRDAEAEAHAQ